MDVLLRRGATGPVVWEVRSRLTRLGYLTAEDTSHEFDHAMDLAVRAFQQDRGIDIDGIVGPATFRHLEEARWRLGDRVLWYSASHPHTGDDVADLQRRIADLGFPIAKIDGVFGRNTDASLREFQRNFGMMADGTCGLNTVVALKRLDRAVRGGMPERLWDEHTHATNRTGIADKVIVIDPGHGGPTDPGSEGHGLTESLIAEDLARRVEGRLQAIGTMAVVTRPPSRFVTAPISEQRRATIANDVMADLVISIHADAHVSPKAHGAASYYFGSPQSKSVLGESFAEIVQETITQRTDLLNCGWHPKTWELLRFTRMPAVRIEVGYLSHPGDASRLALPRFRDTLSDAIAAAAIAFFSPIVSTGK